MKNDIPTCKMCGSPLYEKPQLFYDGRRKYCSACAEWRKRTQDAQRMKEQRVARRNERTQEIENLKGEVMELKVQNGLLARENESLRRMIVEMRG